MDRCRWVGVFAAPLGLGPVGLETVESGGVVVRGVGVWGMGPRWTGGGGRVVGGLGFWVLRGCLWVGVVRV